MQVPHAGQRKNTSIEEKRRLGGSEVNSQWLFLGSVLAGKEEKYDFLLLGSAMGAGHESAPFWSPGSIVISVY